MTSNPLPFAIAMAALIILAGVLSVRAAESPRVESQAACLSEFFRFCGHIQLISSNEQEIRACIAAHKASFSPHCLALSKEIK